MSSRAAKVVKRAPVVEVDKPAKPFLVQLRDVWRKNRIACVGLGVVILSWLMIEWFNRNRSISNWAHSQGFSYSSAYDYKLARQGIYFDALSRGTKSYAFNVMKGSSEYQNQTTKQKQHAAVTAFDFCYTEVKQYQERKKMTRIEKVLEMSTLLFTAEGYKFKTMIIKPRDMISEYESIGVTHDAQVDPDVEELLEKQKNLTETAKQVERNDNSKDEANVTDAMAVDTAVAVEPIGPNATDDVPETVEEAETVDEPKLLDETTHPASYKFNETFRVESLDDVQTDSFLSPEMKQLLLSSDKFIIDFQEDQLMIYRDHTIEPHEYSLGLNLGTAIMSLLPRQLPVNETLVDKKDEATDVRVFVSKREV